MLWTLEVIIATFVVDVNDITSIVAMVLQKILLLLLLSFQVLSQLLSSCVFYRSLEFITFPRDLAHGVGCQNLLVE